ncbi:MAG: iron ABC transporter permease [Acidimicrobiia bacterium]|nr:iron ABC transporter permease [Acidimicrobiia bacterium]
MHFLKRTIRRPGNLAMASTETAPEALHLPRGGSVWVVLGGVLLVAMTVSAMLGSFVIAPDEVIASVLRRVGIVGGEPVLADAVLWGIRLPRIVLGAVAGAGLAAAGAVLQGVFRNGLADPHLLGIGPGAALFAAAGAATAGGSAALVAGTVGGTATGLLLLRLGRRTTGADPTRLVLIGVALGATLVACTGFVVFGADSTRVPPVEFWLLGSVAGSTWGVTVVAALVVVAGIVGLVRGSAVLDLLLLGSTEARHLGLDVAVAMRLILATVGAMVGVAVGAVGVISFVGLVGPHSVRRLTGVGRRQLIPATAVAGAIFVVVADLVARTVIAPAELPVGLITALVGGPLLLALLVRRGGLRS